jgi:adenylate cyclase
VSDHDDLIASGLYDPDAPDAPARLELLTYLLDDIGASIPEVVAAAEEDRIMSFTAFRVVHPDEGRCSLAEAADRAGVTPEFALAVWRAAGFADPRPFERRFGDQDVALLALVHDLGRLVSEPEVLQLVRTFGSATAQIAGAEIAVLRSNIEAPLQQERRWVDIARAYATMAEHVFPRVADAIDTLHRHHLDLIARRYSDSGSSPSTTNVIALAVGFADLSDYTGVSAQLDPAALAAMLASFEAATGDVIAAAGASIVKRIGDEVMFVSSAPGVACALALDLVEEVARRGLPKLRVGLAFGDVIGRQGDFYGPVVNLAARLVAQAEPGTALADRALFDRLARVRGRYTFAPAGRLTLSGFDRQVDAFQLLRP